MHQANALLGLYTQTSLHAGAGSANGVIDLPIQREGHTGWPCVYGSGVKGALRAQAVERLGGDNANASITAVFGPDINNASDHGGALMVGDARLLLLPVRSLTTHFKWVTCPAALHRLRSDAARLGLGAKLAFDVPAMPEDEHAWIACDAEQELFLEEYRLSAKPQPLDALITALASLMERPDSAEALQRQLVVVADDRFADLARVATPVAAHVRLESETKTVAPGALWYEETLPPDTLLTVALSAVRARRKEAQMEAENVLDAVLSQLPPEAPWLQLGGNETVGMGWCAMRALKAEG